MLWLPSKRLERATVPYTLSWIIPRRLNRWLRDNLSHSLGRWKGSDVCSQSIRANHGRIDPGPYRSSREQNSRQARSHRAYIAWNYYNSNRSSDACGNEMKIPRIIETATERLMELTPAKTIRGPWPQDTAQETGGACSAYSCIYSPDSSSNMYVSILYYLNLQLFNTLSSSLAQATPYTVLLFSFVNSKIINMLLVMDSRSVTFSMEPSTQKIKNGSNGNCVRGKKYPKPEALARWSLDTGITLVTHIHQYLHSL